MYCIYLKKKKGIKGWTLYGLVSCDTVSDKES